MYLDHFERILFQFEEISDIFLGPWLVHKTQREHGVIVTLDGHGGDEALGGYPWHVTALIMDKLNRLSPWKTMELVRTIQNMKLFPPGKFISGSIKIGSGGTTPSWRGWIDGEYSPIESNQVPFMGRCNI
jgi:hypothetical protein